MNGIEWYHAAKALEARGLGPHSALMQQARASQQEYRMRALASQVESSLNTSWVRNGEGDYVLRRDTLGEEEATRIRKGQSEEELRQWEAGIQQGVVDHHQTGWQRLLSRVTGAAKTT